MNEEKAVDKETTLEFTTMAEEANSTPKWKKYVLIYLVVGIMIFSFVVIGLYFLSYIL